MYPKLFPSPLVGPHRTYIVTMHSVFVPLRPCYQDTKHSFYLLRMNYATLNSFLCLGQNSPRAKKVIFVFWWPTGWRVVSIVKMSMKSKNQSYFVSVVGLNQTLTLKQDTVSHIIIMEELEKLHISFFKSFNNFNSQSLLNNGY